MTFLTSRQSNRMNIVVGILLALTIASAMYLVFVYNRLVNIDHEIREIGDAIRDSQTANAELKDEIYGIFSGEHLDTLAEERLLIRERNPEYLEISTRWYLASHY